MKVLLTLLALSTPLVALTSEEIVELASKDHSEENLIPELKVFPMARTYSVQTSTLLPEKLDDLPPVETNRKLVAGRYLIYETAVDAGSVQLHYTNVITYLKEESIYKMWSRTLMTIEGKEPVIRVDELDGLYLPSRRVFSWIQVPDINRPGTSSTSLMAISDNSVEWMNYNYTQGKLSSIVLGTDTAK